MFDTIHSEAENKTSAPLVSVVIPTYNRAHVVRRAIDSVLAQTFADFEIIVVDDGSTDRTDELVQGIPDWRIRYIRNSRNLGLAATRNAGIRQARGQYIALLDSDDEWLPEKLDRQLSVMRQAAEPVGLTYTGYDRIYNGKCIGTFVPSHHGPVLRALLHKNVLMGCSSTALISRTCLVDIGLFDERLRSSEDYDLWLRIAKRWRIEPLPVVLARICVDGEDRLTKDLGAKEAAFDLLATKYKCELPRSLNALVWASRYTSLGISWLRKGEKRSARRALLKAVRVRPCHLKAWALIGLSHLGPRGLASIQKARDRFRRLLAPLAQAKKTLSAETPQNRGAAQESMSRRRSGTGKGEGSVRRRP